MAGSSSRTGHQEVSYIQASVRAIPKETHRVDPPNHSDEPVLVERPVASGASCSRHSTDLVQPQVNVPALVLLPSSAFGNSKIKLLTPHDLGLLMDQ